jgi:CubicO group peptidase (beta-lactamase class C family)
MDSKQLLAFQETFNSSAVPGAAIAVVTSGEVQVITFGVKDAAGSDIVTEDTVFDAASLTKPLVAYAVLQLVDLGVLDLDERLSTYAPFAVADAVNFAPITIRQVLSHTSGLPNGFGSEPLRVYFDPGGRFSYASTGFTYLQRALEMVTGEPLEAVVRRLVFDPLGMKSSSLIWQDRFSLDFAWPHEGAKRLPKQYPPAANASFTLQTTARDYGAFVAATLRGRRLERRTHLQWLTSVVNVPKGAAVNLDQALFELEPAIGWGLGWGIEIPGRCFFQWGKIDGVRAFAMGNWERSAGVVLLTNGNSGLRLIGELVKTVLPGDHPAIAWLNACVTE